MGFTSWIFSANRCKEFESNSWYFIADMYTEYIHNDNLIHMYSFEDYIHNFSDEYDIEFKQVNMDKIINYVHDNTIIDEFGHHTIFKEHESWCSSGACFHKTVEDITNDEEKELTKTGVIKLAKYAYDSLKFIPVCITHAYKELPSESELHLISCDGVEIMEENETLRRIPTFESGSLYESKDRLDDSQYYAYDSLLSCCLNVLDDIDFDSQIVFYEGGW